MRKMSRRCQCSGPLGALRKRPHQTGRLQYPQSNPRRPLEPERGIGALRSEPKRPRLVKSTGCAFIPRIEVAIHLMDRRLLSTLEDVTGNPVRRTISANLASERRLSRAG